MGDIFKHFIDLIKDKTTSWGLKTALFISILGFIFLSDYYLGFSYNYHLNNKIEQLKEIRELRSLYNADSSTSQELLKIEKRVLERKHYSDRILNFTSKDSSTDKKLNLESEHSDKIFQTDPNRSVFWMVLSSNYLMAIILPFLIFLPIYNSDTRTGTGLLGWFASLVMIAVVGIIVTWIAYQIPLISNRPIYNYILNFVIHTVFWAIVVKLSKDKRKKN